MADNAASWREHNIRDPKYCDKQEHIIKGEVHETWIDIPPKEAYEQIFGEAFREYNSKQRKKERQFNSYWEKVKKSKDLVPVREALITIGNVENIPDPEVAEKVYGLREKLLLDVKEVAKESADNVVWESDLSKREVATDQMLRETKILAERAGNANESKATPFYTFADDINFDDARLMASKS